MNKITAISPAGTTTATRTVAPDGGNRAPARANLLGCPLDTVTLEDAVRRVVQAMTHRQRLIHVAVNVAKLVRMGRDPVLHRDVSKADLITADGMGIVLGTKLVGQSVPERVTGIDLMDRVFALSARKGFRPYILGAQPKVLNAALYRLQLRHPALRIAGSHHGYFAPADEAALVAKINASGADCLFVGLPTPMKERFIARHADALTPAFVMGVGGSIDVLAGHVKRAPRWMQRSGLEWLYRIAQEPRRMWRRYLVTNTVFLGLMLRAATMRIFGKPYAPFAKTPGSIG